VALLRGVVTPSLPNAFDDGLSFQDLQRRDLYLQLEFVDCLVEALEIVFSTRSGMGRAPAELSSIEITTCPSSISAEATTKNLASIGNTFTNRPVP
jgi:hypothetical protein